MQYITISITITASLLPILIYEIANIRFYQ